MKLDKNIKKFLIRNKFSRVLKKTTPTSVLYRKGILNYIKISKIGDSEKYRVTKIVLTRNPYCKRRHSLEFLNELKNSGVRREATYLSYSFNKRGMPRLWTISRGRLTDTTYLSLGCPLSSAIYLYLNYKEDLYKNEEISNTTSLAKFRGLVCPNIDLLGVSCKEAAISDIYSYFKVTEKEFYSIKNKTGNYFLANLYFNRQCKIYKVQPDFNYFKQISYIFNYRFGKAEVRKLMRFLVKNIAYQRVLCEGSMYTWTYINLINSEIIKIVNNRTGKYKFCEKDFAQKQKLHLCPEYKSYEQAITSFKYMRYTPRG